MPVREQLPGGSPVKKIVYYGLLALASPCLALAFVTALGEALVGDEQNRLTRIVARPFLWAVEREDD